MQAKVITILNKLQRKDSITGQDVWYKTILHDITYSIDKIADVQGTNVSMGQQYNILIPFNDKYLPYRDWKNADRDNTFTMSQGDYIFIGVELEEDITPNNVIKIRTQYEPDVCEVRTITEVLNRGFNHIQLKVGGI